MRRRLYLPVQAAQGLPNAGIASAWRAALPFEKQQKTTRPTTGARASASTTVETAIRAARSAGKPKKPAEKAGKGNQAKARGLGTTLSAGRDTRPPSAPPPPSPLPPPPPPTLHSHPPPPHT